jgi:hypothetical protein
VNKSRGVIRDQTYSIRLYDAGSMSLLMEDAGFSRVNVHADFSPHDIDNDYGFMNNRLIICGQKRQPRI